VTSHETPSATEQSAPCSQSERQSGSTGRTLAEQAPSANTTENTMKIESKRIIFSFGFGLFFQALI
jgi:hypothetical protein